MPDGKGIEDDRNARFVLLRDYTRTMGDRIASLRKRANLDAANEVLDQAFQELEIAREELAVADEKISSSEARFEEALRILEARVRHYGELFDGAPDGYVLSDALGILREGNQTFAAMIGVHKRFLEGKPLVNFVARRDVRGYRASLGALLRGKGDGDVVPLRLRPRHGEPVFVAEMLPRVVRGMGDCVTSVRWSIRRAPLVPARTRAQAVAKEMRDDAPSDGA